MASIITSEFAVNRIVAPRLPSAATEYDRQYQDQFNNILRLYFNQIDNILGQLVRRLDGYPSDNSVYGRNAT
jgi:hypothetical protein